MRKPGEHTDPLAAHAVPIDADRRPQAGPIAVMPESSALFDDAIAAAGGTVAPLSDQTRGLVWLSGAADELAQVLRDNRGIGWIQLPLAGVENYAGLFAEFGDRLWTSAKSSFAEAVAEHAVALTLGVLRQLPEKSRSTSWAPVRQGISLYGRHVLVVGAGGIAVELMRLLAPFEVVFTIVRRSPGALEGAHLTVTSDRLLEVLPDADVVILAAAATDETAGLMGETEFAAMKPTAAFVNIARGRLVDQEALVASLNSGHLWGAGLDVTSPEPLPDGHPLWTAPRTVITSHSADTLEMVQPLLAERVRLNVVALLDTGAFVGLVDTVTGY